MNQDHGYYVGDRRSPLYSRRALLWPGPLPVLVRAVFDDIEGEHIFARSEFVIERPGT
jgi:hypothetical protein